MSRSHNNNYVVNILVFSLIFAFGILSALNIVLIKNVSTILQKTQVLQKDLSHEISLTKKCIDKIDNRHDQELLKKVINTSNNTLIGVDYEGKIFAWSNGALEMLGYTKSEIVGKSLHSLVPDALKDKHRQKFISKINDPTDTQIFERYISCSVLTKSRKEVNVNVTVIGIPNGISIGTIELKEQ
tara:strand:- start:650 stop:1204 length:555 start_codon:yes stop_codon:yes gene_type:complete